ncbi:hypothetical protein RMATCC62417_11191 [Rhizopus microsporus]|nr:hypothetical protein RMATCC62417_11191 [Rhizopus microsporus]
MDQLYQLFCIPKPPALSIKDFKDNNFNAFLDKSMRCAHSISNDAELKQEASQHIKRLISNKSNSPSNTLRTVNTIFESASKACHFDRERALVEWMQVCVVSAVESALNGDKYPMSEKPVSEKPVKEEKKNQRIDDDDDLSWREEEEDFEDESGDSDDDYVPPKVDDDDVNAIVPVMDTPKKKKSPRKKKNGDQVVPSNETALSVVKEGAGAKTIHKYFLDMTSSNSLPNGYFAKAFFFPSKESFKAFISVLNSATKTLDICVFAFTDDDIANALIAAKKRKVAIRIITDNQQAAGKGADAKRLSESYGIPFKTDHTQGYMHNKFVIVDGQTLVNGSFNWSKGARFKNRENVLITNIPLCIQEFQAQFDALWKEF